MQTLRFTSIVGGGLAVLRVTVGEKACVRLDPSNDAKIPLGIAAWFALSSRDMYNS